MSTDKLSPEQIVQFIADFSTRRTVNLASARFGLGTVSQVNYGFLVTILKQLQESEECTRQLEKLHERNKKEIERLREALKKCHGDLQYQEYQKVVSCYRI